MDFAADYFNATIATLGARDLREILFDIIPRKVSIDASAARSIVEVIRAFFAFLKREYRLDHADACLRVLGDDAVKKLEAALLPSSEIKFWRIKNSWGAFRDDRSSAPGFPGYHDLYMDYMNGPITWCPSVEGAKTSSNCRGTTDPFENIVLPPGY